MLYSRISFTPIILISLKTTSQSTLLHYLKTHLWLALMSVSVVLAVDVRVKFDDFRKTMVATATSKTIFTVNPGRYIRSCKVLKFKRNLVLRTKMAQQISWNFKTQGCLVCRPSCLDRSWIRNSISANPLLYWITINDIHTKYHWKKKCPTCFYSWVHINYQWFQ